MLLNFIAVSKTFNFQTTTTTLRFAKSRNFIRTEHGHKTDQYKPQYKIIKLSNISNLEAFQLNPTLTAVSYYINE